MILVMQNFQYNCNFCCFTGNALCHVCGTRKELLLCHTENLSFCKECSKLWHVHPERTQRGDHNMEDTSVKLKLISVICIETSHYVCFTRVTGSGNNQWLFFDSMAERQGTAIIITF